MMEKKTMSGVEFLNQIPQADARARKLRIRLMNLEALATDIARHMNGPIGHGQPDQDRTGTLTAEICDAKEELKEAEEAAAAIREEVGRIICQIEDETIQTIMLKRFAEGKTWKEIAGETAYSEPWVYTLRRKGIEEINRLIQGTF